MEGFKMGSSITEALERTFNLAALRREATALHTTTDWQELKEIRSRYEQ